MKIVVVFGLLLSFGGFASEPVERLNFLFNFEGFHSETVYYSFSRNATGNYTELSGKNVDKELVQVFAGLEKSGTPDPQLSHCFRATDDYPELTIQVITADQNETLFYSDSSCAGFMPFNSLVKNQSFVHLGPEVSDALYALLTAVDPEKWEWEFELRGTWPPPPIYKFFKQGNFSQLTNGSQGFVGLKFSHTQQINSLAPDKNFPVLAIYLETNWHGTMDILNVAWSRVGHPAIDCYVSGHWGYSISGGKFKPSSAVDVYNFSAYCPFQSAFFFSRSESATMQIQATVDGQPYTFEGSFSF